MSNMRFWIIISIVLHIIVILFFSFKISFGQKKYIDLSYLNITDFKEKTEEKKENKIIIKKDGDITPTQEKVVEETNIVVQEQSEDRFDPDKFMPFYMVEELPSPLSKISPAYPEEARRLGIEGAVVLKIYINEEGCVEDVEIVKSPNELLSLASKKAIMSVRFKPAKAGGKTVPVCMELTLRFKLSG
ncbi:MAG: energy transducer TonB [Brevinematales bacterium]|nr:energy transducer TonB [Brevinematales bacterium]